MIRDELIEAAKQARSNAYAEYSVYEVGAAIESVEGGTFVGCNVENGSFGLTICAERNAIAQMVVSGHRKLKSVVVVTKDGGSPCGACLQVMAEFADDPAAVEVGMVNENGEMQVKTLSDLLPYAFRFDSE